MPQVDDFDGIRIYVYNGDHGEPHFHAIYGEDSAKIRIMDGELMIGLLPNNKMRKVMKWLSDEEVKKWLIKTYYKLNPRKNEKESKKPKSFKD